MNSIFLSSAALYLVAKDFKIGDQKEQFKKEIATKKEETKEDLALA